MAEKRTSGGVATVQSIAVLGLSILWVFVRPDLWEWALGFAVFTIVMLALAHNTGVRQGRESAMSTQLVPEYQEKPEEKAIEEVQLEALNGALSAASLFAYELEHGLVPDGNSTKNPGYGPMDFDEWNEWKQREFERTGNIWHNHPGGLPPKGGDTA